MFGSPVQLQFPQSVLEPRVGHVDEVQRQYERAKFLLDAAARAVHLSLAAQCLMLMAVFTAAYTTNSPVKKRCLLFFFLMGCGLTVFLLMPSVTRFKRHVLASQRVVGEYTREDVRTYQYIADYSYRLFIAYMWQAVWLTGGTVCREEISDLVVCVLFVVGIVAQLGYVIGMWISCDQMRQDLMPLRWAKFEWRSDS